MAERITAYLAGVQERVQAAERERAVAVARAVEERKRRRLPARAGGLGAGAHDAGRARASSTEQRQRSARAATVAQVLGEASTLRDLARADPEDVARWQTALAAVKQAEGVAGGDAEALRQLAALRTEVQAGADAADRDRTLLDRLVDIRSAKADDPDGSETDAAYADAFREAGLDLGGPAAGRGGGEDQGPAAGRGPGPGGGPRRLVGRARGSFATTRPAPAAWPRRPGWPTPTPGATTSAPRSPWPTRMAARRRCRPWPAPRSSTSWAPSASTCWARPWPTRATRRRPRRCCAAAQLRHPGDVWVNYDLARVLEQLNRRDEAIRFYTAARAAPPRDGPRAGPCAGRQGRVRRGDRGLPRPGPTPARRSAVTWAAWARR